MCIRDRYRDVTLECDETWSHPTTPGHTVFAYGVVGDTLFGGDEVAGEGRVLSALSTALFTDGDSVVGRAKSELSRFLLVSGLSLIHISEPTRRTPISYAVFCLKK